MIAHSQARRARLGFTIVEMLVVISVIGVLATLLLPALNLARDSSRTAACQNNLRQIGIGLQSRAATHGQMCTGAFDWLNDGCVTEIGWVADLVNSETYVGQMTCPSNPARISETFNQLLSTDTATFGTCLDYLGSQPVTLPDASLLVNPCRQIAQAPLAPLTEARRQLVETEIFTRHYNTNYTASWFLVRGEVLLTDDGNLREKKAGCGIGLTNRNSTFGPLHVRQVDNGKAASNIVPLIGDGNPKETLLMKIGEINAGEFTVPTMTRGPVQKTDAQPPTFPAATPRNGIGGWWAVWNKNVLQDYRRFGPIHRGSCNVLFADGGVRTVKDTTGDGLLNNGFASNPATGFNDVNIELEPAEFMSTYSLNARPQP